jgi:hypothetical protein
VQCVDGEGREAKKKQVFLNQPPSFACKPICLPVVLSFLRLSWSLLWVWRHATVCGRGREKKERRQMR